VVKTMPTFIDTGDTKVIDIAIILFPPVRPICAPIASRPHSRPLRYGN